jgi:hypothetical protein
MPIKPQVEASIFLGFDTIYNSTSKLFHSKCTAFGKTTPEANKPFKILCIAIFSDYKLFLGFQSIGW